MKRAKQLELALPRRRGGKRRGAGRKPVGRRALVSHAARPRFDKAAAVHVTLRVADHVWNLRSGRSFRAIQSCFEGALGKFGLRLIQFSVLGNHLHLIVEADSSAALSRGMQGLCVRLAKALNRMMRRHGTIFADHYHARIMRSPTELVTAIAYVLGNHAHHFGGGAGVDRFSSAALDPERKERVLAPPRTWLLRAGFRRARTRLRDGAASSSTDASACCASRLFVAGMPRSSGASGSAPAREGRIRLARGRPVGATSPAAAPG